MDIERKASLTFAASTAASVLLGLAVMVTLAMCLAKLNAYLLMLMR